MWIYERVLCFLNKSPVQYLAAYILHRWKLTLQLFAPTFKFVPYIYNNIICGNSEQFPPLPVNLVTIYFWSNSKYIRVWLIGIILNKCRRKPMMSSSAYLRCSVLVSRSFLCSMHVLESEHNERINVLINVIFVVSIEIVFRKMKIKNLSTCWIITLCALNVKF